MSEHHIEVNKLDEKKKKSLANRLIVAGVLIVLAVPALILGGWFWFAFITLALGVAVYEVMKAPQKKFHPAIWIATYIFVYSYFAWFMIKYNVAEYMRIQSVNSMGGSEIWNWSLTDYFDGIWVSIYAVITAFGVYCLFAIISKDFTWADACYLFGMGLFVGVGFQAFLFVRYYPFALLYQDQNGLITNGAHFVNPTCDDPYYASPLFRYFGSCVFLIYCVLVACLNDAFAYFVGVFLGKHHMNERISPNKTWEGFFGGWILSALAAFGFAAICDFNGFPLLPAMRIFGEGAQWWWTVLLSLLLPLIGVLGDFTFSLIKRFYGFKDYSHVLGAHGGILDRADSIVFILLIASVFAVFTSQGWNFFA